MDGVSFLGEATRDGGVDLEQWEALVRGEYHEGFHRIALALLHMATSGAEVDKDALERSNKVRMSWVWGIGLRAEVDDDGMQRSNKVSTARCCLGSFMNLMRGNLVGFLPLHDPCRELRTRVMQDFQCTFAQTAAWNHPFGLGEGRNKP